MTNEVLETLLDFTPAAIVVAPLAGFVGKGIVETYKTGSTTEGLAYTAMGLFSSYLAGYIAEGVGSLITRRRIKQMLLSELERRNQNEKVRIR